MEKIFLTKYDSAGNVLWAKGAGGTTGDDFPHKIATDMNGNVYMVGSFNSHEINFDQHNLCKLNIDSIFNDDKFYDSFVTKFDVSGNVQWVKRIIESKNFIHITSAIDLSGNIYIAGSFNTTTITFDSFSLKNVNDINLSNSDNVQFDIFLFKLNTDGNLIWAKNIGDKGNKKASSLAVDNFGNIYFNGYFSDSTISFGTTTLVNTSIIENEIEYDESFIVKLDNNGEILWAKIGRYDEIDALGNIYITGGFRNDSHNLSSTSLKNSTEGFSNIFLAKYDNNGKILWTRSIDGTDEDKICSMKVDQRGNIYVSGYFISSSINIDSIILSNNDPDCYKIFLIKYDNNGNLLWAKSTGSNFSGKYTLIDIDNSENIYLAGNYWKDINFDSTFLKKQIKGFKNIFLAKFDPNGNELWAKGVGGNNNDIVISITKDNLNNIYVSGVFRSIILQFELKTLTNISGYTDSFINKLFPKEIAGFEYLTYLDIHPDIVNDKLSFNIPDYSKSFDYILEHSICLPINVEIFNVEGIMLREFVVEQNNTVFNISELPKGIYFSKMENADGTVVGKYIKE